jgi:hypothetical protein
VVDNVGCRYLHSLIVIELSLSLTRTNHRTNFCRRNRNLLQARHPILGPIAMEYSAFAVDGRPDLSMIVFNPVAGSDVDRVCALIVQQQTLEMHNADG